MTTARMTDRAITSATLITAPMIPSAAASSRRMTSTHMVLPCYATAGRGEPGRPATAGAPALRELLLRVEHQVAERPSPRGEGVDGVGQHGHGNACLDGEDALVDELRRAGAGGEGSHQDPPLAVHDRGEVAGGPFEDRPVRGPGRLDRESPGRGR